jgi:predicted NBD/HSP70 family sugar kinase
MKASVSKKIAQKSDRELAELLPFTFHGSAKLPAVYVESYNVELRERRRFVGDRANKRALIRQVEKWRKLAEERGERSLEDLTKQKLTKKKLERALESDEPGTAGVLHAAIDDFAEGLVDVIERYRKQPEWKKVNLIVVGGGLRAWRLGELAIGKAQAILYERKIRIELRPIRADPDEAGLIGAAYLEPGWLFAGYQGVLAVDIGGSSIRAGVLQLRKKRKGMVRAEVAKALIWEHGGQERHREDAVARLTAMLKKLVRWSKQNRIRLAPFIGVGCPGRIRLDGAIDRGTQNLPGNWEAERFNLPVHLSRSIDIVRGEETVVVMHNDAVVQGLSELPYIEEKHWAVLTIGTGLGNAKFTARDGADEA